MSKIPEKATEAVKFLERMCFDTPEDEPEEVVRITDAIRATQMAELEAIKQFEPNRAFARIAQLEEILK